MTDSLDSESRKEIVRYLRDHDVPREVRAWVTSAFLIGAAFGVRRTLSNLEPRIQALEKTHAG